MNVTTFPTITPDHTAYALPIIEIKTNLLFSLLNCSKNNNCSYSSAKRTKITKCDFNEVGANDIPSHHTQLQHLYSIIKNRSFPNIISYFGAFLRCHRISLC